MRFSYFLFPLFFLFSFSVKAQQDQNHKTAARLTLEKALKNYHLKTMQIRVKQDLFLARIKKSIKSEGFLYTREGNFQLELKGQPSSKILFDGKFLWYQTDTKEKVVFKLKDHPQIDLLTVFFNTKRFFETFDIKQAQKSNEAYILKLLPKKKIEGLSEILIKVDSHISEVRIIWENLNNWQKFHFSKPIYKELPDNFFQFSTTGFHVVTKT